MATNLTKEEQARAVAKKMAADLFAHGTQAKMGPEGVPHRVRFVGSDGKGLEHDLGGLSQTALTDVIYNALIASQPAEPAKA